MKAIFNDASELSVQQVYIAADGALHLKTISVTEEELRAIFSDPVKTRKIVIQERGQAIAEYENYTNFDGIYKQNAGILEPCLYKVGESPTDMISALEQAKNELREQNEFLQGCILEMSEMVYQ